MKLPSHHNFSPENRSRLMASIRSRGNRSTEQRLASGLRSTRIIGWRRHMRLPGTPDFTFPQEQLCIFVHGCFWHGCPNCYRLPKTRAGFWRKKVAGNRRRDDARSRELRAAGYKVITLWECQLVGQRLERACNRILRFLENERTKRVMPHDAPSCQTPRPDRESRRETQQ